MTPIYPHGEEWPELLGQAIGALGCGVVIFAALSGLTLLLSRCG